MHEQNPECHLSKQEHKSDQQHPQLTRSAASAPIAALSYIERVLPPTSRGGRTKVFRKQRRKGVHGSSGEDADNEEEFVAQEPTSELVALGKPPMADGDDHRGSLAALETLPGNYLQITTAGIFSVVWHRTTVLVSLLLLQSLSQFILELYEPLISKHVIIPLFLTMLVGAGGNAGNQATVRAITGLVTKEFHPHDYLRLLRKECAVGFVNAIVLAGIGFARVYYFYGNHDLFWSTVAITASLFAIVFSSVILGCTLPFLIGAFGFDREHAAPVIQVTMDIVGVLITCSFCSWIIPVSEHRAVSPR